MLFVAGLAVADVLLRWVAGTSITAMNEIVAMGFAVAVPAVIPAGIAASASLVATVPILASDSILAARLRPIGALLLAAFLVLLAWRIGVHAHDLATHGRTTVIIRWPLAPSMAVISIELGLGAALQCINALVAIRQARYGPTSGGGARKRWSHVDFIAIGGAGLVAIVAAIAVIDRASVAAWAELQPAAAVIAGFVVLWACISASVPLAAATGLVGLAGTALFVGVPPALSAVATETAGLLTNPQLAALPLFLLMGSFAAGAGVFDDLFRVLRAAGTSARTGLPIATIIGCAGFGAVSGSSLAAVSTVARASLPQLLLLGHRPGFAAGCIAAGGTLGALIPPSGPLIIFSLLTGTSVAQLFAGALIPGLLTATLYVATIVLTARRLDPSGGVDEIRASEPLRRSTARCGAIAALFAIVVGGMYSGILATIDAAAIGALAAAALGYLRARQQGRSVWQVITGAVDTTALIYLLLFGVFSFSFFVSVSGVAEQAHALLAGSQRAPLVTIAIILLGYVCLGSIFDSVSLMIITLPIIAPVVTALGYDIVWWGVICLVVVELGLITPPFGLHLFVIREISGKVSLGDLFRGIAPFCLSDLIKLTLLVLVPGLSLWLPSLMYP